MKAVGNGIVRSPVWSGALVVRTGAGQTICKGREYDGGMEQEDQEYTALSGVLATCSLTTFTLESPCN